MTTLVLRGGRVFDGSGSAPRVADVVIEDDRIIAVEPDAATAPDAVVRDVAGHLVAPGLIDAHVHAQFDGMDLLKVSGQPFSLQFFEAERNLGTMLDSGITTARDGGGIDLGVKRAVELGLIRGPELRIAITPLSQTGGHIDGWNVHGDELRLLVPHPGRPDAVVDGIDAIRKRVREVIRAGADTIKVCASGGVMSTRDDPRHPQFSYEELAVCVEEAANVGIDVMAHAHGAEGILRALRAGVRSIEHGVYLDDAVIESLLETKAWLVPTLLAPVTLIEAIENGMTATPEIEAKARAIGDTHRAAIARAHAAGVRIAMGTDSGVYPHGQAPRELALMMEAGLSASEALVAATSSAAELLRMENEVGRVAPGYRADLIVMQGGMDDIAEFTSRLRLVIQRGAVVRDALT